MIKTIKAFEFELGIAGSEEDPYFQGLPRESESDLFFITEKYLEKDSIYFDIGANIGITALSMAKYLDKGLVYAFEPSHAYNYLKKNAQSNFLDNIHLFNIAIGEQERTIEFQVPRCSAHSHRLTETNYDKNSNLTKRVKLSKLDNIIKNEKLNRLDFIKIDVEGFESDVIRGCNNLIRQFNPIFFVEFNSFALIAFKNESPRVFLKFLCDTFTNLYVIRNNTLTALHSQETLNRFLHENLVFHGCVDNLVCCNGDIEARSNKLFLKTNRTSKSFWNNFIKKFQN